MLNFVEIERVEPKKRDVLERLKDYDEVTKQLKPKHASEQSDRCINCGDPYCHNKCPLHNMIPYWLKQTYQSNLDLAFDISNETSPFPEILGKICPQDVLCEGACTLNDGHGAVTIGAVENHISEMGFEKGLKPYITSKKNGKKVAVVGSGPAGISVATFLLRDGFDVEMFERADRAGGLLTYGIPNFKFDKSKVERRIGWLVEAGMKLTLNCEIGVDKSFDELKNGFDAVFIGIGATKAKSAKLPNEEKAREIGAVVDAMEFLTAIQKRNFCKIPENFIDVKDKKVVVIGGGDTAMDCLRSSVREKASSVSCLYRRDEKNMPGSKKEYVNSVEEGVEFVFNVSPKSIVIENDGIAGIKMQKTELTTPDESGRQRVQIIDGSDYIQEADIIIYALGFDVDSDSFLSKNGIKTNDWGEVEVDENLQTSVPNIYAGGDCYRGADLAVRAAADGKKVAKHIAKSLV
jgi:glutamate synthase (NADPH/NADH) small chain